MTQLSCTGVADEDDRRLACAQLCQANEDCVGFDLRVSGDDAGECCLLSQYNADNFFTLPGVEFYGMEQCDLCVAGYFKKGRSCARLSTPPAVDGGALARTILIPLNTAAGTELTSISATAETNYGPVAFTLGNEAAPVAVSSSGVVTLARALETPGTIEVSVLVTDARAECAVLDPSGAPRTTQGGCVTRVALSIRTAVFLNCPSDQNAYLSLSESAAALSWQAPTLPSFISGLGVTRDLADAQTSEAPFLYSVGRRRVTYTTEDLSVGGKLVCSFDVVVQYGFRLLVESIGRKASPERVQQFLVVDPAESNQGVRLPSFTGSVAGRAFSVGLVAPLSSPFTISPSVRRRGRGAGG